MLRFADAGGWGDNDTVFGGRELLIFGIVVGMHRFVARAIEGTLLFRDWVEARALWDRIVRVPRFRFAVLMPDHLHIELLHDDLAFLGRAMQSYTQWRNARRSEKGRVWRAARASEIRGAQHRRRTARYIHLNPCRRGLVVDPLAWPFSTHRDAVDATAMTVRRTPKTNAPALQRVHRVLGDPHFSFMHERDLRLDPRWSAYRQHR